MTASNGNNHTTIHHIMAILEERVHLYRKRQLEIKRSIKAHYRGDLIPSVIVTQNLFEAVISFEINRAALKSLNELMQQSVDFERRFEKQKRFCTEISFLDKFHDYLIRENSCLAKIGFEEKDVKGFCKIVFSIDEEYQRKQITDFVIDNRDLLVKEILTSIAIFDDTFFEKLINNLEPRKNKS